ncbi:MAG: hypothetical protein A2785_03535 [Candidatus Chisholmbacteria bacterium RIFCSPHIGHO2_01_FULL_49_18]|uniref:Serine aminopeptidase S33 domain-containing protein n=2 Tax=Candidatus Chisholmiibacteriota TaxID=1817900 RepID=A0A1G1VN44_9BACT|nr:MAG: hypothetical protein A2785_03535 [Candidatus Chisholmbacteria bacterium RIFCSPHIGHO2_01_FULL_49_18]OGY19496.1 MAG: hypothetical protein A3A65_06325 [Candidatus Chisholmbacteria bacterium RIFCSPLOWO2_01_FULL_49_14]
MKTSFTNRKGKRLVVQIDPEKFTDNLVFIAHGLGGFKEQPHIQIITEAFLENNFTAIRWDMSSSIGESEGSIENATLTDYYEDLEDVISWAERQIWYIEPFMLSGHSIGSASIIMFVTKHPNKVKGLAPISAFLSGRSYFEFKKNEVGEWKKKGFMLEASTSKPGVVKKLSWNFMEDILKYNFVDDAEKLTLPVLLIVGSEDQGTPYKDQKKFFDNLASKQKELHVIKGAPQTFYNQEHLVKIKEIMKKWIKKVEEAKG